MGAHSRLREIPRQALVFAAGDTMKNFTIRGGTPLTTVDSTHKSSYAVSPGKAVRTLIEIPDWANDVSMEFKVEDPNGTVMFRKTNLAKGQTAPPVILMDDDDENSADYPVFEGCVVILTLSGVPGTGGGTPYVTIYYK